MSTPNLDALFSLFETAKTAGIKYPKIWLKTPDGISVVLTQAGPKSRYEGTISVTTGEPYGTPGSWHGRVNLDGTTSVARPAVVALLVELASNPADVAAYYGRQSGHCCFCGRDLSTSKIGSSEIGYGPICADKYGLPWNPNGEQPEIVIETTKHENGYTEGLDCPF